MRVPLVALSISVLALVAIHPRPLEAHHPSLVVCQGWSADDAWYDYAGGGTYFWNAETGCNDAPDSISVATWLKRIVFDPDGVWRWEVLGSGLPLAARVGSNPGDLLHSTIGGQFYVTPFDEPTCYQVRSLHVAWHGNLILKTSESGAECW